MLSHKIRTAIVTLVAATSLAGASLVPAAAQAAPKETKWENTCQNAQVAYENANTLMEGSTTEQEFLKNQALKRSIELNALRAGCSVQG